jgi:hypothetical protein
MPNAFLVALIPCNENILHAQVTCQLDLAFSSHTLDDLVQVGFRQVKHFSTNPQILPGMRYQGEFWIPLVKIHQVQGKKPTGSYRRAPNEKY